MSKTSAKLAEIQERVVLLQEQRDRLRKAAENQSISDERFYTNGSNARYQSELARLDNLILAEFEALASERCNLNNGE